MVVVLILIKALNTCDLSVILPLIFICTCIQEGKTPLMAAAQNGKLEVARVLVKECNCNINARDLVRFLLLCQYTCLHLYIGLCGLKCIAFTTFFMV